MFSFLTRLSIDMSSITSRHASICGNIQQFSNRRFRGSRGAAVVAPRAAAQALWPDEEYIDFVASEFPDAGVATVEQARCLYDRGYDFLDVRCAAEIEASEKMPNPGGQAGSINARPNAGTRTKVVPLVEANRKYDAEKGEKVFCDFKFRDTFLADVAKAYPDKEAKIMVCCSDGRKRAMAALDLLDSAGYVNLVGVKGGANSFNRDWDAKLRRRNLVGKFKQNYQHKGDSPQLHGTGSAFKMADAQTYGSTMDDTPWELVLPK
jgi:rhodanese-related sulfurtransferase